MPVKDDSLQTTSSKHPIPQNVMDVEFKVVGDLTLRQFMYLVAGAIIMYIFSRIGLPSFWKWALIIFSGFSCLAVAFIPLQERSLDTWITNFIKSLISPSQRVWKKSYYTPEYFLADYASIIRNEIVTLTPVKSRNKLTEYLGLLPTDMNEFDINEKKQMDEVANLFKNSKVTSHIDTTSSNFVPTKTDISKAELEMKKSLSDITGKENKVVDRKMYMPEHSQNQIDIQTKSVIPNTITVKEKHENSKQAVPQTFDNMAKDLTKTAEKAKDKFKDIVDPNILNRSINLNSLQSNLTKQSGTINLNQTTKTENILDQAKNYNSEVTYEKQDLQPKKTYYVDNTNLPNPNKNLEAPYQAPIPKPTQGIVKEEEVAIMPTDDALNNIVNNIKTAFNEDLKQKPIQQTVSPQKPITFANPINKPNIPNISSTLNQANQVIPQTNNININTIYGLVKGLSGEPISMALVLIKNEKGDVIRALNTNDQGQFMSETSLPNGKYIIDTIKGGYKFESFMVDLLGKPTKPLSIFAKP